MYNKLQYISQGQSANEQLENIQVVLDAGCPWVQLRFKNAEFKELIQLAEKVRKLCSGYKATFIMNDHVNIAKIVDADGVHLGLLDSCIHDARNILGNKKIIGGTANTFQDVSQRISEKCDYVGLGPFRFTKTKEKLSPILGKDGIASVMKKLQESSKHIPIFAIGGIMISDVSEIMSAGVYGIAVSGGITQHENKKDLIKQFNLLLYGQLNHSW